MAGCDDDSLFVFDGGYFALVYDGTLVDWFACIKI